MIKRDYVSYDEFMKAVNSLHNIVCCGCIEGTLLDDLLYVGDNDYGVEIVLLAKVQYLNANSSCYTVKIAHTDRDKDRLYGLFYDMEQQASYYD